MQLDIAINSIIVNGKKISHGDGILEVHYNDEDIEFTIYTENEKGERKEQASFTVELAGAIELKHHINSAKEVFKLYRKKK